MKISLNWIKKYVDVSVTDDELVRLIGARLVEVEGVIDEAEKYNNIYIVEVTSAEKIPDTHLTLCQINVGKKETVQVVCGAPNVREGMLAAWIAPGAIVPASIHEDTPFVIGKRKMLNKYESNGMLAGADELDFGDDHSGIVEIEPGTAKPGDLLKDVFELDDKILEIENKSLTHRPDCFGIIGFSREVAGILGESFNYEYQDTTLRLGGELKVAILNTNICERYTAVVLQKHGEIKKKYLSWMDTILSKSGMKPISPIVDVTNYLMLLTGQPLHAFDYDKFVKVGGKMEPEINVRLARDKEKIVLLDDTEVILNENDIVICSGEKPVALAGAMGGKSTMIDENTRNIIIESATFSLYNLRKTQMAHGIFSEAITRFTKGQPPYQCLKVAEAAAEMLKDGYIVTAAVDSRKKIEKPIEVKISVNEINALLGTFYEKKLIVKTLTNVGFKVENSGDALKVIAPLWRTDIHIKEDIIEEVGRLLGYDNIQPILPLHSTADSDEMLSMKTKVRDIMASFGANEVLTYSFVSGKLLEKAGLNLKQSYRIINSISPELQYIRQSIVPSLLDKAYMNQKLPVDKFAVFEINKTYTKKNTVDQEGVPFEDMKMGFVLAERKGQGTAYYKAKLYAEKLLEALNLRVDFLPLSGESAAISAERLPFEPRRSALVSICGLDSDKPGEVIGVVGEFKNSVRRNFKLGDYLAGFELDFAKIVEHYQPTKKVDIRPVEDKRDLTIETDKSYNELLKEIKKVLEKNNLEAEIYPLAIYQPETIKHISVHLEFKEKINDTLMQELEKIK
ncbi:phenylalanine--tRNA ligase subunit beta [Candidatus Saccharibacteria bacterium]|nr:phenylalanine--tRNA ligase subunit beta [Candidatus Saccharibacteria bacterium]